MPSAEGGTTNAASEYGVCICRMVFLDGAVAPMPQVAQSSNAEWSVSISASVALCDGRSGSVSVTGVKGVAEADIDEATRCAQSLV